MVNFYDVDLRADVRSGRIPKLLVEVDYDRPILSQIPNGTFGCGAPADENVYEDPYSAEVYPWEVDASTWNQFQAQYHNITDKEYDDLCAKRRRDIEDEKLEFDSRPSRRRCDDDVF